MKTITHMEVIKKKKKNYDAKLDYYEKIKFESVFNY